jgi:hypothetical protein
LGIITKIRAGKVKKRMILDTSASDVKSSTRKGQRVILPRLLDAINQTLTLMALVFDMCNMGTDLFVLDFTEAFWQMPLHSSERKFFAAMIERHGIRLFIIFLRMVQGSRSAPLCWARLAALLMRLTQSLFDQDRFRIMCFVDDPIAAITGTLLERRLCVATVVLVWEALGFPLAYRKGQLSKHVTWIGGTLAITDK